MSSRNFYISVSSFLACGSRFGCRMDASASVISSAFQAERRRERMYGIKLRKQNSLGITGRLLFQAVLVGNVSRPSLLQERLRIYKWGP